MQEPFLGEGIGKQEPQKLPPQLMVRVIMMTFVVELLARAVFQASSICGHHLLLKPLATGIHPHHHIHARPGCSLI